MIAVGLHRSIEVTIEGRPPTLNARRHWRSVARDNANWKAEARQTAVEALDRWQERHGLKWEPLEVAELQVVFVCAQDRPRDWDNLISSLKPLLDGCVAAGIIRDDSTRCISGVFFDQVYVKGMTAERLTFSEPAG